MQGGYGIATIGPMEDPEAAGASAARLGITANINRTHYDRGKRAAVLQRIFEAHAAGQSLRAIAKALNAEQLPGPRGGKLAAGLLSGGAARGSGMLRNRPYIGERVWDRGGNVGARLASARRPKWQLAGLVRCGLCEGPMSVAGKDGRLACENHVERGTCGNRRKVLRHVLLARVLVGLKDRLMAPDLVEAFAQAYVEEANLANRDRGAHRVGLQARHAKLDRQVRNYRKHPVSTAAWPNLLVPACYGALPAARLSSMGSCSHSMPYRVRTLTLSPPCQ